MRGSTKSMRPLALGCLAFTTAVVAGVIAQSTLAAPQREPEPVTCELRAGDHRLQIRARDLPERIEELGRHGEAHVLPTPAFVVIERRIDEITVIDATSSAFGTFGNQESFFVGVPGYRAVRSCGARPTVTETDSIEIGLGRHSDSAALLLDLRYGALGPGFTDEGDGSSEIEIEARLGGGAALVQATRSPDAVAVMRPATEKRVGPTAVNLNADEASPDSDLVIGRHALVQIDGAGGDDALSSTGGAGRPGVTDPVTILGGQGDDSLTGGHATEGFFGGPGRDRIDAGAGSDVVFALGRGGDRIDCGPGIDFVLLGGGPHRLHGCERRFDARTLENVPAKHLGAASRLVTAARRALRP